MPIDLDYHKGMCIVQCTVLYSFPLAIHEDGKVCATDLER